MDAAVMNGLLGIVSFVFPKAAPVIAILEKATPYIEVAAPVIEAAVKEGISAFEAAKEAAPELTSAIKDLVSHVVSKSEAFGDSPSKVEENLTRSIFGLPHMTFEEEMKWMDGTTGNGINTGGN